MKEFPRKGIEKNGDDQNTDAATENNGIAKETYKMPFLMLGLDLPPPPLFKDVMEKNIIPQVPEHLFLHVLCYPL